MNTLFDDYEAFTEKFKVKKTTDDCHTPENVYEAVKSYALKLFPDWEGRPIARPFYPGGDYEKYDYDNAVVIDNPPFSIFTRICRFFCKKGIPFFLFAPGATALVRDIDVTYVIIRNSVTYSNGAFVATSFVTNHTCEFRLLTAPDLDAKIAELNKVNFPKKKMTSWRLDEHVTSLALLRKYCGADFFISKDECVQVSNLQANKRALFGGGFLIADQVVERLREQRERLEKQKERQREEKSQFVPLSPAEREAVRRLNESCKRNN